MIWLTLALGLSPACGRKGDPQPRPRLAPAPCQAEWVELRWIALTLPKADVQGNPLVGLEAVRVYYLPLDYGRPEARDVIERGEVVLERRRPDLPGPGERLRLDLSRVERQRGWMAVAAVRVGNVIGAPSALLPWFDPRISPAAPAPRPTTPPPPPPSDPSAAGPAPVPAPGA